MQLYKSMVLSKIYWLFFESKRLFYGFLLAYSHQLLPRTLFMFILKLKYLTFTNEWFQSSTLFLVGNNFLESPMSPIWTFLLIFQFGLVFFFSWEIWLSVAELICNSGTNFFVKLVILNRRLSLKKKKKKKR